MKKSIGYILFFLFSNFYALMANNTNQSENYCFSELRTAILEEPIDLKKARKILREIRTGGGIELIDSLINFKEILVITSKESRYVRNHRDTPSKIITDIAATITYLNLGLHNNIPNSEKCTILMNELEKKLNQGKVIDAEISILYENATSYAPCLLKIFDTTENNQILNFIAISLRGSDYPNLEEELLKRMDKHLDDVLLFGRLTVVLTTIGTDISIKKLEKIYQKSDNEDVKEYICRAIDIIEKK